MSPSYGVEQPSRLSAGVRASGGGGAARGDGPSPSTPLDAHPRPLIEPFSDPPDEHAEGSGRDSLLGAGRVSDRNSNRRSSGGGMDRRSTRGEFSAMDVETLKKELAQLAPDLERDIGKVYRKYERLERQIRTELDRRGR